MSVCLYLFVSLMCMCICAYRHQYDIMNVENQITVTTARGEDVKEYLQIVAFLYCNTIRTH